jgi:transmembrane sensor
LLIAGIAATAWWLPPRAVEYHTGIGEQRTLRLSDGSSVELNSRSRIAVRFYETQRVIELTSGQALFQVAKDPKRPFLVSSDAIRVRAIGTRFDVNRRKDGTVVTVVEGRVAVADEGRESEGSLPEVASPSAAQHAATTRSEVLLYAGQQVTVQRAPAQRAPLAAIAADSAAVTAWSRGELVFRSEPLSSVIDEFNRYNARRIVLESSVEDFPITATFATTDSHALVKFLAAQPDLRVDTGNAEIRIRAAGATASQK